VGLGHCSGGCAETEDNRVVVVPDAEFEEEKWCPSCEQYVALSNWYSNSARYDGVGTFCKLCDNKKRKARMVKDNAQEG